MHGSQLCITKNVHEKFTYESHAPPYVGHRGIQATIQAIETYFFWPSMRHDIHDYVEQCIVCQKVKYDRCKAPGLPIPDDPLQKRLVIHGSLSETIALGIPRCLKILEMNRVAM